MKRSLLILVIVGVISAGTASADVDSYAFQGSISTSNVAGVPADTPDHRTFTYDTRASLLWLLVQPAEAGWGWVIRGGYESRRACDADLRRDSPWIPGLYCAALIETGGQADRGDRSRAHDD